MENIRFKVLQVEDDQIEQRMFQRFIEDNSIPFDCTSAGSVCEARHTLVQERFDIVISDHDLGDGSALDVIEAAKDIPTIVVTGAGDEETAINAIRAGAYDYLVKDIDQHYLKAIPITVEQVIKRKKTEDKLQLLSGAVMSTEDSVYITDMRGAIIFVNKAFCRTYGYKEQEIVGQSSSILWIGKNQAENTRSVFQTRGGEAGWEVGFYHGRKDGSVFPVSLSRSTIKNSNRKDIAMVGVVRDISERIMIEDELKTTCLKLKKRNRFQNEMAILVSASMHRLLADGQIDRAAGIIKGYLDISKISTDKVKLDRTYFNFKELVNQVEEALKPIAAKKNVPINNYMPDADDDLIVYADYDRMGQILSSLLNSAIKYSSENQSLSIQVKDNQNELEVEIHDNSTPLTHGHNLQMVNSLDWIKQQFYAGHEDIAFGLWIAKNLVGMQGGHIWAKRAEQEKGNIICFTIPKAAVRRTVSVGAESTEEN